MCDVYWKREVLHVVLVNSHANKIQSDNSSTILFILFIGNVLATRCSGYIVLYV